MILESPIFLVVQTIYVIEGGTNKKVMFVRKNNY